MTCISLIVTLLVICVAAASAKTEVHCGSEVSYLPDPDSCDHFFICNGGHPFQFQCPSELLWNRAKTECDFAFNTNCFSGTPGNTPEAPASTVATSATTPKTESTSTAAPETTPGAPSAATTGTTVGTTLRTTAGTTPETVVGTTPGSKPEPPSDGDLPCVVQSELFFYEPLPGSCTKFYLCSQGVFKGTYTCGEGLYFSREKQSCSPPSKVQCSA